MAAALPDVPVPDGYMKNAQGALIPEANIREIDLLRHQLVLQIVAEAHEQQKALRDFRDKTFADLEAFFALSAERYNAPLGGIKGNVTLTSFDGHYKIIRARQDTLVFDEGLQVAKAIIDECLQEWTRDSRAEVRALIDQAFQVDKEGNISTARVLGLRRLKIEDARWLKAMQAISDAVSVASSKAYVRVYKRRGDTDKYDMIALDLASV